MANQFYNYNATYGGPSLSSAYSSRHAAASAADPYHSDPSRYFSSDVASDALDKGYSYLNQSDPFRYSRALDVAPLSGGYGSSGGAAGLAARSSWSLVEGYSSAPGEPPAPGVKRSMEALYHPTVLGTHNTIGQSEAYFATNPYAKRPRFESASNLPVYPQRPGEKDCAHYMLTRMCKFGGSCKFDHPLWVPEGGIPDWKEVPLIPNSDALPERPGEPDCPYFLKTQKCKFGFRCKFNHPKDTVENASALMEGALETVDVSSLPERPSEPICSFYIKTGKCKFGTNCKFHHPKNIEITAGQDLASEEQNDSVARDGEAAIGEARQIPSVSFAPALLHNSKGLPIRPGEVDCSFYLKTGSCKYGATCRFNHPDITSINPPIAATLGQSLIASPAATLPISVINPMASFLPNFDSRLAQTSLTLGSTVYPQRPGQIECDFYMKTGECKFGERCKFHHPIDRTAPAPSMVKQAPQPSVKLTLAGLPRREGAIVCPFYMKTGTCKYSAACRFDHPPPGEAIAMATVSGEEKSASDPAAAVTP